MRPSSRTHRSALAIVTSISLAAAACSGGEDSSATTRPAAASTTAAVAPSTTSHAATSSTAAPTTSSTTTTVPGATGGPPGIRRLPPFADYRWVPPLAADVYGGPATPTSIDDVLLVPAQGWLTDPSSSGFDQTLIDRLEADAFVVRDQGPARFFHDGYKSSAYWEVPIFVTTDALYHSWHLVFDKVLRDTEQQGLLPILEQFLVGAVEAARVQEAALAGSTLVDAAHRTTAFYEAAATVLELDVGTINDLATEEAALVDAAAGIEVSPITGSGSCDWPDSFLGCVDYSLFLPRGHYNRTPELQRYFRAMSVLGQEGFALDRGIGVVPGLLTSRVILRDPALVDGWTQIYQPTAFLVGLADDVDPYQLATAADAAVPGWQDDPTLLIDADALAIASAVLGDHPVAIDPERASMRVMGARFTLDSFILDQLAWPNVGNDPPEERRVYVSALDVAAAFGSSLARDRQLASQSTFLDYADQLEAMSEVVASPRARRLGRHGVRRVAGSDRAPVRRSWHRVPRLHAHSDLGRQVTTDRTRLVHGAEARHRALHQARIGRRGRRSRAGDVRSPPLGGARPGRLRSDRGGGTAPAGRVRNA